MIVGGVLSQDTTYKRSLELFYYNIETRNKFSAFVISEENSSHTDVAYELRECTDNEHEPSTQY